MSGCPEKDLHSIYIDGEMPEKYAKEYEAHIEHPKIIFSKF